MAPPFPNEADAPSARFEAVALPFMNALYGKALHLTRRPEDAGDLVQETFLRAYRTFANFAEGTNCKAWLFTILYSIFVNRYRKAQREPDTVSIDELEETYHRGLADPRWDDEFAALAGSELDWQGPEIRTALAACRTWHKPAARFSWERCRRLGGRGWATGDGIQSAVLGCATGALPRASLLFRLRPTLFQLAAASCRPAPSRCSRFRL